MRNTRKSGRILWPKRRRQLIGRSGMESPTNSNIFRPSPEQGIERVRPDAVEFSKYQCIREENGRGGDLDLTKENSTWRKMVPLFTRPSASLPSLRTAAR